MSITNEINPKAIEVAESLADLLLETQVMDEYDSQTVFDILADGLDALGDKQLNEIHRRLYDRIDWLFTEHGLGEEGSGEDGSGEAN